MIKKFTIVCLCLIAVAAVFGLNDRLTYEGFQVAGDMISASSEVFEDDIQSLQMIVHVFDHFQLGNKVELILTTPDDVGKSALSFVSYYPDGRLESLENFYFSSAEKAEQMYKAFLPVTWGFEYDGLFSELISVLNAILMLLGVIFSLFFSLIIFVFDAFSLAFSVIDAGLYLLGF